MDSKRGKHEDYYRLPSLYKIILGLAGMSILTISYVNPELLPLAYLGRTGRLWMNFIVNRPTTFTIMHHAAWGAHVVEAYMAYTHCSKHGFSRGTTIKWMLQTLIFGMFSLSMISNYDPERKRQKRS